MFFHKFHDKNNVYRIFFLENTSDQSEWIAKEDMLLLLVVLPPDLSRTEYQAERSDWAGCPRHSDFLYVFLIVPNANRTEIVDEKGR